MTRIERALAVSLAERIAAEALHRPSGLLTCLTARG